MGNETLAQQPNMNPADAPAFVCGYGPSGHGKTTDMLYAMPRGFYIAHPAALKPSVGVVGFQLHPSQIWDAQRIADVTAQLPKLDPKQFDGVVVDDFSLLAERTFSALEKVRSGFKLWGALRDEIMEFRDAARRCRMHVLINCHELPPQIKAGRALRGGPKLPGTLPEDLPVQCDMVLRTFVEPSRRGAWGVVYRCGPNDPSYVTKDRHNRTPDMAPMNIGEILRSAGYVLRRAPGLEWMEEQVEIGAQQLLAYPPDQERAVLHAFAMHLHTNVTQNLFHIRWALRDAADRVVLRRAHSNLLAPFFA